MSIIRQLIIVFYDKIPFLILINFVLFLILIVWNWSYIKNFLLKIDKKTWAILMLIFLIALFVRIIVPPHQHIMYIDEPWYMEAGKNMLQTGYQGDYPKSIGWPFILRIAFTFGISNWVAIYTSTILGALTIFNIFFLTFIITKHKPISLISSLLSSLFAAHIRWSTSAEANVGSLFFITMSIFLCFLYYRNKKNSLLWLALVSLAFTAQFRPENYTLPLLFLAGCIFYNKKFFRQINFKFILPWVVLIVFSFVNLIQVMNFQSSINWIESDTEGQQTGSNWGFNNLIHNSSHYGIYIFNSEFQPVIFSLFILSGLVYMFSKQKKEGMFLITWFCLLWFVYFFSWFQTLGGGTHILAKTRFFINFYPITVIFAGYGILLIKDLSSVVTTNSLIKKSILPLITIILVILFIPYSIKASTWFDDPAHKLETKIPELAEKDIPHDCIIIMNWPTILKATTNLNVIDINKFLENPQDQEKIFNKAECVLFFEELTCSTWNFEGERCKRIKDSFSMEPFITYKEENKRYTFYKIMR